MKTWAAQDPGAAAITDLKKEVAQRARALQIPEEGSVPYLLCFVLFYFTVLYFILIYFTFILWYWTLHMEILGCGLFDEPFGTCFGLFKPHACNHACCGVLVC